MMTASDIKKQFFSLFPQNFRELKIPVRYGIGEIAERLCVCRYGRKDSHLTANIQRSISDNFDIQKEDPFYFLSRKYLKKNQLFYMEPRYFSLETCIELAIAAGMSRNDFWDFSKLLMGMNWIYLRNPEYLIGRYCIQFGLSPADYYELKTYANDMKVKYRDQPLETRVTVEFNRQLDDFMMELAEKYQTNQLQENIKTSVERLIEEYAEICEKVSLSKIESFLCTVCTQWLTPQDYAALTDYAAGFIQTNVTNREKSQNSEAFRQITTAFLCRTQDTVQETHRQIKEAFKPFLEENILLIQGNISRTMEFIQKIIREPEQDSWLFRHKGALTSDSRKETLSDYLLAVSLPWEYKKTDPSEVSIQFSLGEETIEKVLRLNISENSVNRQLHQYFLSKEKLFPEASSERPPKEQSKKVDMGREGYTENVRFENINMRRLRNDLIRIMLMNMTADDDPTDIRLKLKEYSFYELREDDPFDFLVLCTLDIYQDENKPYSYKTMEPYEILKSLFALVRGTED